MKQSSFYFNDWRSKPGGVGVTADNGDVDLTKRIEGGGLCTPENPLKASCCECYERVVNNTRGTLILNNKGQNQLG